MIKSLFKKKWSAVELGQASGWMDGEGVLTFSEDAFYLPPCIQLPPHTHSVIARTCGGKRRGIFFVVVGEGHSIGGKVFHSESSFVSVSLCV